MADADLDARAAEAERSVSSLFAGRLLGLPGNPPRPRRAPAPRPGGRALELLVAGPLPRLRRRRRPARAAPRRRDRRGRAGAARRPAARHDPAAKRRPVPQRVLRRHGLAGPRERPARGAPGRARPRPTRPATADLGTGPHRPAPLGGHRRPRRRRLLEHDTRLQERPRQRTRRAPSGPDRGRHRRPVARRVDVCAPAGPGLRPVPRRRAAGRRRGGRRPRRLDVQPGDGAGCPRHPGRCARA